MHKVQKNEISFNDQAYEILKESIVTLAFKPGEYLNTAILMDKLNMGRTPINHALHRLENEELIQIIPRKGVMVSPLSIDDALSLIEVRCVNEVLCVRLAAARINKSELQTLKEISQRYARAALERDTTLIMGLDREFHECIAHAAQNTVLSSVLKILHARSQRFWAISLSKHQHIDEVLAEHESIVSALEAHDPQEAERAIIQHIDSFRRALTNGA